MDKIVKNISPILFLLFFSFNSSAQYLNYRIDGPGSDSPEEVTISINPANTNILAAGANIDHFYFSTNSGKTWGEKHMSSTLGVWGDPCILFDSLGNLYYAHLSDPISGYWIDRIVVQKSTNLGKTWSNGVGIGLNAYPKVQDKEWLAVDLSQSKFKGNLYVMWTEFDEYGSKLPKDSSRIRFSRSTDQGETWSNAITVSDRSGNCLDSDSTTEGAVPTVGPNGEIYVSWAGPLGLMFDKSTDGGVTWGKDIFVSDIPGGWDFNVSGIYRCNGMPITMCDISNSIDRGNIYICWGDQRNGTSNSDVFFSKSTDGGETWLPAKRVNDDNTTRHQFFPWMTVDQTTGNLWGVFYDRRNTIGTLTDVYVVRSTDGGETFENIKVSQSSFEPRASVFFGDYTNITAWNKKIYPIWMRLNNDSLSVWTVSILDTSSHRIDNTIPFIPDKYFLYQNYPNPFNTTTTISYQLPEEAYVIIKIFDALGNEIKTIFSGFKRAGIHEVDFDGKYLSSGIYLYRIDAGNFYQYKKMVLLK